MPKKKTTKPTALSYSHGEFDGHPFQEKLHTAFGFDLPRVCEAAWECVEALREEQAIEAAWPDDVKEAADRLREIAPRHAELCHTPDRSTKQQKELDLLTTDLNQAIQILQKRPRRLLRTRRDMNAMAALSDVLFLTSAEKWRSLTGRERPRNLTELREAMAEAGCTLSEVHDRNLTPRFAEPILLGRLRQNTVAGDDIPQSHLSKVVSPADAGTLFGVSAKTFTAWFDDGKIRGKKITSKAYQIHLDDLPRLERK